MNVSPKAAFTGSKTALKEKRLIFVVLVQQTRVRASVVAEQRLNSFY